MVLPHSLVRSLRDWLLNHPSKQGRRSQRHSHPWWQVLCLTGVDYFSTLGYQPGIAALAAGSLSPLATLVLVLVTLFGALPIYRQVAHLSPHGEGSIAMLEHLLPWWQGKLLVLCLLGFVATDFIITITLSAADATAHILENPFLPSALENQAIPITLILVALLGVVFLQGFEEAIGIAIGVVVVYLILNGMVLIRSSWILITTPNPAVDWWGLLGQGHSQNPWQVLFLVAILFPKLALGLSGFETGVAVMPLVKGRASDTEAAPWGRIQNTEKLLITVALIMSGFLLWSSLITTLMIEPAAFQPGGSANGRALAYLAHRYLGNGFGTIYDLSTIAILWFAGASAMAGLLTIVPRYLPRYGMAPNWARASRPLVLVVMAIAFIVTLVFRAQVDAQGGAYATGVLVLMTSAALAVTLYHARQKPTSPLKIWQFGLITLVFLYTTIVNIDERPDGVKIASLFIGGIVVTSLISRIWRSTEIRAEAIHLDPRAQAFVDDCGDGPLRIIAHRPRNPAIASHSYATKLASLQDDHYLMDPRACLFLEVQLGDASNFLETLTVTGHWVGGYRVLRLSSAAVPNAIAALLLHLRDYTGQVPHAYFGWVEGNPLKYLFLFLLFGEGDTAIVTREVLRRAERDASHRPIIHVGGAG